LDGVRGEEEEEEEEEEGGHPVFYFVTATSIHLIGTKNARFARNHN
jgi:hypothetical protein